MRFLNYFNVNEDNPHSFGVAEFDLVFAQRMLTSILCEDGPELYSVIGRYHSSDITLCVGKTLNEAKDLIRQWNKTGCIELI